MTDGIERIEIERIPVPAGSLGGPDQASDRRSPVEVEVEVEVACSGDRGPGIVFLHGLGGSCRSWDRQLASLATDFGCRAWTMPGYGRSGAPEPYGFEMLADCAAALIETFGRGPVAVVGHSMGGYVAQELALRHPGSVRALVLAGTTAAFGRPGSDFNRAFLAARLAPLDRGETPADLAPAVVDGLLGPSPDPGARAASIGSMSAIEPEDYRRALQTLVTWDATDRLSAVTAPTLCLAGRHDTTAPPRAVARLADAIPGARFEVMADVGHLMNAEAPDEFSALVAGFAGDPGGGEPATADRLR